MAMFSTFIAWGLHEGGLPIGAAIACTLAISFIAGMVIERVVIRPFEGGQELTLVIVTLGLFILLNSLAGWIWGFGNRGFPSVFRDDATEVAGVQLSVESLGIVAVLLVVVGLLFLLFQRTQIGLGMRAAALNPQSSQLVGIRVGRMLMLGWGLAAMLGALAGVLVAPRLFLDVNLMAGVLIYAFAAAALGGFDSPFGAVIGGWIIGVSENLAGHVRRLHRRRPEDPRAAWDHLRGPAGAAERAVRHRARWREHDHDAPTLPCVRAVRRCWAWGRCCCWPR